MTLNQTQIEYIENKFSEMFSDKVALGNMLQVYDEATYEAEVRNMLVENGFPSDIDISTVNYDVEMGSNNDPAEWAEIFIDVHDLTSTEEFEALKDNTAEYDSIIVGNLDMMNIEIHLKMDYEEWIDENPTVEYFASKIESDIDVNLLEELIPTDSSSYDDKVREALLDDGFSDEVTPQDVEVGISNVRYKSEPAELADKYLETAKESGGVRNYMTGQFFIDILVADDVDYDVEIESDVEDFNE